jgi:uncharacterized delta-60 repeat protein
VIPAAILAIAVALIPTVAVAAPRSDPSFGANGIFAPLPDHPWRAGVFDMARDAKGRFVVTGGSSPRGADGSRFSERILTARFLPNGNLDNSFGDGGFALSGWEAASGVEIQRDGKAVVAGYVNGGKSADINYRYEVVVARFNRDGTLDRSFSGGYVTRSLASAARDVAIQPNGRIVGVGVEVQSFREKGIVFGLKPNGRIDRSFGGHGRVAIFAPHVSYPMTDLSDILVQPDGKLLVVGMVEGRNLLVRLLPNGRPDPRFGGGDGRVAFQFGPADCQCSGAHAVRLQSNGRIIALAHEERRGRAVTVARFLPSGRLDRSFGPRGQGFVRHRGSFALGLAVQRNDKIVVAGERTGLGRRRFIVLRFMADGRPDRSFGSRGIYAPELGVSSFATSAVALPDGRVVVAGISFTGSPEAGSRGVVLQRFAP